MQTDGYLTFEAGVVKLGNTALPGIFVSMDISTGVRFDRAMRDHMSGKAKVPLGWEDADIKLTLDLLCDQQEKNGVMVTSTCYDKLAEINRLFKNAIKGKNKANPRVYEVSGSHLGARGVKRVVFSGLDSREDDQSDVIQAVLAFTEHIPAVVKREKNTAAQASAQAKAAGKSTAPATKAQPATDPKVTADPFIAGWEAGSK